MSENWYPASAERGKGRSSVPDTAPSSMSPKAIHFCPQFCTSRSVQERHGGCVAGRERVSPGRSCPGSDLSSGTNGTLLNLPAPQFPHPYNGAMVMISTYESSREE